MRLNDKHHGGAGAGEQWAGVWMTANGLNDSKDSIFTSDFDSAAINIVVAGCGGSARGGSGRRRRCPR